MAGFAWILDHLISFSLRQTDLGGLVEGGADLFYVGAVDADGFVKLVAGDVELLGPVSDVGGHLGVDLLGVVGAFDVGTLVTIVLGIVDDLCGGDDGVFGVGDVLYGAIVFLVGHGAISSFKSLCCGMGKVCVLP